MNIRCNAFIANITKMFVAYFALYVITLTLFHIYGFALLVRAQRWEFYVYPFDVLIWFLDYLLGYRMWQESSNVTPVIRLFFVMLLSFCSCSTCPTEVAKTFGALNLTASTGIFADWNATLRIWTRFRTIFNEKQIEFFFRKLILFNYVNYWFTILKFF